MAAWFEKKFSISFQFEVSIHCEYSIDEDCFKSLLLPSSTRISSAGLELAGCPRRASWLAARGEAAEEEEVAGWLAGLRSQVESESQSKNFEFEFEFEFGSLEFSELNCGNME